MMQWKKMFELTVTKVLYLMPGAILKAFQGASLNLQPGDTYGSNPAPGIRLNGLIIAKQAAPAAKTTSITLTAAEIIGGLLTANQGAAGAATYTMPTGTLLQAALPPEFAIGDSFDFSIVNISTNAAEIVTVAGGTGTTAVGNMVVSPNVAAPAVNPSAQFRVRKTADVTFSFYRLS